MLKLGFLTPDFKHCLLIYVNILSSVDLETFASRIGKNVNSSDPASKGVLGLVFQVNTCCVLNLVCVMLTDVAAYPESVNVLSDITSDVRTPDKLIDGVNDTVDGRHMWLAPILPNIVRCISYFICLCLTSPLHSRV